MKIKTTRMNKRNFADYGNYIDIPNTSDSNENYSYARELAHLNLKTTSIGHLRAYVHEPQYTSLERHKNTPEMLVVLNGQGTILFAKPGNDPNDGLLALHVEAGDSFVMSPSTWHGLITPSNCDCVEMLVMFEKDTEDNDIDIQDLTEAVVVELLS